VGVNVQEMVNARRAVAAVTPAPTTRHETRSVTMKAAVCEVSEQSCAGPVIVHMTGVSMPFLKTVMV
jgi:hypothetical protein